MAKWIDPRPWVTGEYIHQDLFNVALRDNMLALRQQKIRQTADVAKTTTTLDNLTGLELPVLQGEMWHFQTFVFFTSNATANLKLAFKSENVLGTATNGIMFGRYGLWGSGAPIVSGHVVTYVASPGATEIVAITTATSLADMCVLSGTVLATVDGFIQAMGAQSTASGTTTFRENSFILAWRVDQ